MPSGIAGVSLVSGFMQLGSVGGLAMDVAGWFGIPAIGMTALASLALPANPGPPERSAGAGAG